MRLQRRIVAGHREIDDLAARPVGALVHHARIVGVQHADSVRLDRVDDDGLAPRKLVQRVDIALAQMVAGDVEQHADIAFVETEATPHDAAAGHLEHGVIDGGSFSTVWAAIGPE